MRRSCSEGVVVRDGHPVNRCNIHRVPDVVDVSRWRRHSNTEASYIGSKATSRFLLVVLSDELEIG